MLFRPALTSSKKMHNGKAFGRPKRRTAAELGTCVNTMVLIKPIFRANGPAKTAEIAPRKYDADVASPRSDFEG